MWMEYWRGWRRKCCVELTRVPLACLPFLLSTVALSTSLGTGLEAGAACAVGTCGAAPVHSSGGVSNARCGDRGVNRAAGFGGASLRRARMGPTRRRVTWLRLSLEEPMLLRPGLLEERLENVEGALRRLPACDFSGTARLADAAVSSGKGSAVCAVGGKEV